MTPGVALFYSGLCAEQMTVSAMMLCFGCMSVVSLLWSIVGFSLAFAPNDPSGVIGTLAYATLDVFSPSSALVASGRSCALLASGRFTFRF